MVVATETDASPEPTREDLLAFSAFADAFSELDFRAGGWVRPSTCEDGVIQVGWWSPSATVAEWEQALHARNIMDPLSDYLDDSNVAFVNQAIANPSVLVRIELPRLRRVLTFLARAERHAEGGWYESAFQSGMAQMATRQLVEIGSRIGA